MSLRKYINRLLAKHGYEVSKLPVFKNSLSKEILSDDDFFFVQIGANDGVKFDNLFEFVMANNCSGIVVEPLNVYFSKLRENYKENPSVRTVKSAICHGRAEVEIFYVNPECLPDLPEWAEGLGSIDREHLVREGIPSDCIMSEKVECVHLMDMLKKFGINKVNLLQIDVEGYDAEVIKMIDFDVIKPHVIKYERKHLSKSDQRLAARILKSEGYQVFRDKGDNIAIL